MNRALALAGIVFVACVGSSNGVERTRPLENKPDPLAVTSRLPLPQVVLIEPGALPRRSLRIAYPVGTRVDVALRMTLATKVSIDGVPIEQSFPRAIAHTRVEVSHASRDRFRLDYELVEYDVEDDPAATTDARIDRFSQALSRNVGLKGRTIIDNRGFVLSADSMLGPTDLASEPAPVRELLARLAIVLPKEAIGVGGKWRVEARSTEQGIATRVTTTFEVVAIEGDVVSLHYAFTQVGAEGAVKGAQLPAGAKMELLGFSASGEGEQTLLLSRPRPAAFTLTSDTSSQAKISSGSKTQRVDTGVHLELKLLSSDPYSGEGSAL